MHYNISDKVSFQAGLTPAIRKELNHINTKETERIIEKQFNTDCNFQDNCTLALGTYYALNLLKEASEKFGLPFRATPPSLRVYKPTELIKQEDVLTAHRIITLWFLVMWQKEHFQMAYIFLLMLMMWIGYHSFTGEFPKDTLRGKMQAWNI